MKIMAVDDERLALRQFASEAEELPGVELAGMFSNPLEALETFREDPVEAVFLDIEMPEMNGLVLAERLREISPDVVVVFITGYEQYALDALKIRADYYLTKPFDMQELTAVVKTLVRRRGEMIPENPSYGNVTLNQADYTLRGPEKQISLGKKEYDIMRILMVNREQVVSKETLLLKVWGNDADAVENNVEVYISFLRKKLEFLKANICIVTSRKLGYRIVKK